MGGLSCTSKRVGAQLFRLDSLMLIQCLPGEYGQSILRFGEALPSSLFRSKLRQHPFGYDVLLVPRKPGNGIESLPLSVFPLVLVLTKAAFITVRTSARMLRTEPTKNNAFLASPVIEGR